MKKILTAALVILIAGVTSSVTAKEFHQKESKMLSKKQESIVLISAHTSTANPEKLETALNDALDAGLTINEIKEILVQMYAYCGFPRSLVAINTFTKVMDEREQAGKKDKIGKSPEILAKDVDKYQYGKQVLENLTGIVENENNKAPYAKSVPAIEIFLKEHLFADIFSRGVLTNQERELATIAALSAGPTELSPMLKGHINIALNIGVTPDELDAAIKLAKAQAFKQPFSKGIDNPSGKYFTGKSYLNTLSDKNEQWNTPAANVTFEPAARTNWHTHSGGQILLVTAGEGRCQEKGKPVQILKEGDVVRIPIGVEHWHGAAPKNWFAHVAITTNVKDNKTTWLEPVSDEEYYKGVNSYE